MKAYPTSEIRNVALIGHGDCGKTTLASAMLFLTGAVNRFGRVEDGTTVTDFDDEEIERKISLQTALAHAEWKNKKINLLDTPGYAAFVADANGALTAADSALLLVEGVAGVQVITERTFRIAQDYDLPVLLVITKLDRERASFERALRSIQERFGRTAVPIQIPIGEEHDFDGLVNLLTMKAHRYAKDGTGKETVGEIPAELGDAAREARAALVEMVAEADDKLMEAFFDSGDLSEEQLVIGLRKGILTRKIFPVLCGSASHLIGVQPILDALVNLAPAPDARGAARGVAESGGAELTRDVSDSAPLSMHVFKTIADPYSGRLSIFRVTSGLLKSDSHVVNVNRSTPERLNALGILQGKQIVPMPELHAGDLGVITKLKETRTGDTLADPAHPIQFAEIHFPEASMSFALEPKSKGDEEKISMALARLIEEDPVLRVGRDSQTHELLVSGTGQVHVEVAIAKMKKKFGVEALLRQPKVPYLETVRRRVDRTQGRHKKQTGGRGQFGDCWIELEPLPRGGGFEFVDKIFGGSIPQNFRPAVQKGIVESSGRGWLAGYPVVDFRVILVDGSYHDVDSSEMAFKIAGSLAFKAAMEKAAPTLLEPVMTVEITAPEENMGEIMGDLASRRGKPHGMEAQGHTLLIKAQVPLAEMLTYASTLKSITSDRGTYHMEFDHYDEAPGHVQEKIITLAAKKREEDHEK